MSHSADENVTAVDYFHKSHWLNRYQAQVSLQARRRMYLKWRSFVAPSPGDSVLDVGSTPDLERIDSNCIIPWLNEDGLKVSLYSPEKILSLQEKFPFARIIDPTVIKSSSPASSEFSTALPVDDKSMDWVMASAVIEHVGDLTRKIDFVVECARVARKGLMLTTPNRFHWLEFHTKLPLIHWLPKSWHRALLKIWGLELWAQESHLDLLSSQELSLVAEASLRNEFDWQIAKIKTLGMTSNLILIATRK